MPLTKLSHCHQDFMEIIYKLADICHLQDIEYDIEFGSEDIDSFLGGTYKVHLKGRQNGLKISKHISMKWHPEPMRTCFRESYRREFIFYRHVVPKLLEIQKEFRIIEGLKIKFPNCIFANAEYDKEAIAVLGLLEHGFKFHDRLHKASLEHVTLVMRNLAKLHALSFVLSKTNPATFEEISELCSKDVQYANPGPPPKSMKSYYDAAVDVVHDPGAREDLRKLAPDILTVLHRCTKSDKYSTIGHGDCWTNNIMFKYNGTRPVDLIFIDYQLMRHASPVTDISYFLYMTTERDFLAQHYDNIIEIYYGTLSAVLRQCNLYVEDVYPRNIFEKHLREYSVLGLIEAMISMMIITAPTDEALKMTEAKYEYSEWHYGMCSDQTMFIERVNGVVEDFFSRNYSLDALLDK